MMKASSPSGGYPVFQYFIGFVKILYPTSLWSTVVVAAEGHHPGTSLDDYASVKLNEVR